MALDPRFLTAPSLQMVFRDKDTGLPLRAGYVKFFSDIARTVPKSVYKLSGSPPNYSYTDIGSTIVLTGIGTFSDGLGNDIIPYYFPFDGTTETTTNKSDLYFIQVYSNDNVFQFSREGWPNEFGEENETSNIVNYIPNGQFLLHTDIPADIFTDKEVGQIRLPVTEIAQGGFTFERSVGTTAKDFVTFDRIADYVDNPTGSPRYSINVLCESTGTGADFKDIRIKFLDVNKFASLTQEYTFSITGRTNAGTSVEVGMFLIKNFGTGGDTEIETEIGTCTLTDSYSICYQPFIFGTNVDSTIGLLNDDFLQIAVRFPTDQIFDINVANFVLTIGDVAITTFPVTTNGKFIKDSLVPDEVVPTGNDIGLLLRSTREGMEFDHSEVAHIITSVNSTEDYHLLCDGTQYLTAGYQPDGAPNSRLQSKLYAIPNFSGGPAFGTGPQFLTALNIVAPQSINIHTNTPGVVSQTVDGAIPTGFTFARVHIGSATYGVISFWNNVALPDANFTIWNNSFGAVTAVGAGTSGFNVSNILRVGSTITSQITYIGIASSSSLAGLYFTFNTPTTAYYVWYQVDGVGADPAVAARTGILVNLQSGNTQTYIAENTSNAINGYEVTSIIFKAASLITTGSFFTIYAFGGAITHYYVWYKIDGVGIDPAPIGGTGIMVSLLSTDTALQVQAKTLDTINRVYFAVPDYRGMYLMGNDPNKVYDLAQRYSFYSDNLYLGIGSFEMDSNLSHAHSYIQVFGALPQTGSDTACYTSVISGTTGYSGGTSSNPYNSAVNFFIKY